MESEERFRAAIKLINVGSVLRIEPAYDSLPPHRKTPVHARALSLPLKKVSGQCTTFRIRCQYWCYFKLVS